MLPLVYEELRKLAAQKLAHEKPGQTLQATALVHEAYLRLVGPADETVAEPRPFLRGRGRGDAPDPRRECPPQEPIEARGRTPACGVDREGPAAADPPEDLLAVHESLDKLAAADAQAAELVKLHYFAGLTIDQAAAVLGVSPRKAYTIWSYARAWLFRCLEGEPPKSD